MKPQKPIVRKIDPLKLKANRKVGYNAGRSNFTCPHCLSKLVVDKGKLRCTAEKLFMWANEFKLFDDLSDQHQYDYLQNVDNSDRFLDMFTKWKDNELDCVYNTSFNVATDRTEIPDPMVVNRIEKSLKRELTEEERFGESDLWTDGKDYTDEPKKGFGLFKIPKVFFPDDV